MNFANHPANAFLTWFSVSLVIVFCIDNFSCSTSLLFPVILFINLWLIFAVLEIILLLGSTQVQNSFTSLAFTRLLELTLLVEVSISIVVLCCGATGYFGFIGHSVSPKFSCCMFWFLASVIGLWFERVPFDVVEAESELIDGVTTELPGVVFSMTYAAEVTAFLIILKIFSSTPGVVCGVVMMLVLAAFVGRIFLARMLFAHVLYVLLSLGLGLTQPAFWLQKFLSERIKIYVCKWR